MWTVRVNANIGYAMKFITVEPVMFLQMLGDTLTYVIYQNLFIDKICRTELNYDQTICNTYAELVEIDERDPAQKYMIPVVHEIQKVSSSFVLYNSLVENSLPVILVLFLGVWSDAKKRRKPPLLLSLIGKLCRSFGLLINAWFIKWPTINLLLMAALPHSIGGSNAVFQMAAFSYISDSSTPRNRTWRLGCAEAFWQLGSPIGLTLGAYLYEQGGYLCVFATACIIHLIAVLYTAFLLPEIPQPTKAKYTVGKHGWYGTWDNSYDWTSSSAKRNRYYSENDKEPMLTQDIETPNNNNASDVQYLFYSHPYRRYSDTHDDEDVSQVSVKEFVIGAVKSILKKRPNHTRKCLLSLGFIMLLIGLVYHGELNMRYLFTRNKFNWRELQFSYWVIFEATMVVTGIVIVMPIFSQVFKLTDPCVGAIASLARLFSKLCFAFASLSRLLYLGSIIEIPGIMAALATRSLASKCVLRDERGRVFAFLGCIDALVPLIAVPLYSIVYSNTLNYAPSAIYYLSSILYLIILLTFGVLYVAMKMNIIQFTGTDVTPLTDRIMVSDHPIPGTSVSYSYRRTSLS